MSEERKKMLRTQGRYSNSGEGKEFQENYKDKEKKHQKASLKEKHKSEMQETSKGSRSKQYSHEFGVKWSDKESGVQYQENSPYSFPQLERGKKPEEIKISGIHVLSTTNNGESRIIYEPNFIPKDEAEKIMIILKESTKWNDKNIIIRGQSYPQPRLVAWYGPFPYCYSGVILKSEQMPETVVKIKERVETYLKKQNIEVELNSVLLNYYRNGKDSVAWHSDDELSLGVSPTIASVSLGAVRKFEIRRKYKSPEANESSAVEERNIHYLNLEHGSLLIMYGCMQMDWEHRVPKEFHDKPLRINLTFRTVFPLDKFSREISPKNSAHDFTNKSETLDVYDKKNFPPLNPVDSNENSCQNSGNVNNFSKRKACISEDKYVPSMNVDNHSAYEDAAICDQDSSSSHTSLCINENVSNVMMLNKQDANEVSENSGIVQETEEKSKNNLNTNSDNLINDLQEPIFKNTELNQTKTIKPYLNVNAPNFVPLNQSRYIKMPLQNLAECQCDNMENSELTYYSDSLRDKILSFISGMQNDECDQLHLLCEITDGTQTAKNQKLICKRMCKLYRKLCNPKHPESQNYYRVYNCQAPRNTSHF